jgi:hypothetical protein
VVLPLSLRSSQRHHALMLLLIGLGIPPQHHLPPPVPCLQLPATLQLVLQPTEACRATCAGRGGGKVRKQREGMG